MKHLKKFVWLMVLGLTVLLGTTVAGADDPKKPAAVSASAASSNTGGAAAASAKPAAVQASSTKATVATHLEIVDFSVNLKDAQDSTGIYRRAQNLAEVRVTVKGHGIETEIAGSAPTGPGDAGNYDGLTAFQILVDQGYFVHKNGVGFILTKKGEQKLGIGDDSGPIEGQGQSGTKKGGFMGTDAKLDISPPEKTDMVDPAKTESVAEDPSQQGTFGGLFGEDFAVDGECMAGRDKMYTECTERCKTDRPSYQDFGDCVKKCSKDALAAYGDCDAPARTQVDEWE